MRKAQLEPLTANKDNIRARMLSHGTVVNRREFRASQRKVAEAVRSAKEDWISDVAGEASKVQRDGCVRWKYIQQLQTLHKDCHARSITTSSIRSEEGVLLSAPGETQACRTLLRTD